MDQIQGELDAEGPPISVRILGVNAAGAASGNAEMCNGRDIPWLQDTADEAVWTDWNVAYRDVVLLNPDNEAVDAYNLTDHNLGVPENYTALQDMIRALASGAAP